MTAVELASCLRITADCVNGYCLLLGDLSSTTSVSLSALAHVSSEASERRLP